MRTINMPYIDRVETKVTPAMLDSIVGVCQLMGISTSEFLRRAILEEIWDQYPNIARWCEYTEAFPENREHLEKSISDALVSKEEYARLAAQNGEPPW